MRHKITFLLILVTTVLNGQILFNNTYAKVNFDYSNAVIECHDGKFLIAGSSRSQFATDYDVNILLIDSLGNVIWDKYIGQSPRMEFAYSLIETKDSNFVVTGRVNSSNPFLMKFNLFGELIWDREYLSTSWSEGFSVGQTFDEGYYFVGTDYNTTTLFLTNEIGDTIRTRKFDSIICKSIVQTSDSGFVMTGYTNLSMPDQDIVIVKTNSIGDTLWTKKIGGAGNDDANSVQQLSDEGYLIAGSFDNQIVDGEKETYIIRTNALGDTLWTKKYFLGVPTYVKQCKNNNGYILSTTKHYTGGFPSPDIYRLVFTKLDISGNIEWSREFEGFIYSAGNNITQTSDGGFLLNGSINNAIESDIILIKLDSIGNYVLSLNEISNSNDLKVFSFPNPSSKEVNFVLNSNNEDKINQIQIFNSIGQEIQNLSELSEIEVKIDITNFKTGLYFYKIKTGDKQILTNKIVVIE